MREFSLVSNDGEQFPDFPQGLVLVFGSHRSAVAYLDYDGNADRSQPREVRTEWANLGTDFDSIMAWHGETKQERNQWYGKIKWGKQ